MEGRIAGACIDSIAVSCSSGAVMPLLIFLQRTTGLIVARTLYVTEV